MHGKDDRSTEPDLAPDPVRSLEALEACFGRLADARTRELKVLNALDAHALRWIEASTCMFGAVADPTTETIRTIVAGGEAGFVDASAGHLTIPSASIDEIDDARPGLGWGALFLVPGMNESLRVNGVVEDVGARHLRVRIAECYLHCAKAFMRSSFWNPEPADDGVHTADVDDFCAQVSFALLATCDTAGGVDVSPKGDPAGRLLHRHGAHFWFPDRPGNRRVDSFRNLLVQSRAEYLALVPGADVVLRIRGPATISEHVAMRESFTVQGKVPRLVVRIAPECVELRPSPALTRARLWNSPPPPTDLDGAEIFRAHVRQSPARGVGAAVTRAAISVPGVLRKGLEKDYEQNLY